MLKTNSNGKLYNVRLPIRDNFLFSSFRWKYFIYLKFLTCSLIIFFLKNIQMPNKNDKSMNHLNYFDSINVWTLARRILIIIWWLISKYIIDDNSKKLIIMPIYFWIKKNLEMVCMCQRIRWKWKFNRSRKIILDESTIWQMEIDTEEEGARGISKMWIPWVDDECWKNWRVWCAFSFRHVVFHFVDCLHLIGRRILHQWVLYRNRKKREYMFFLKHHPAIITKKYSKANAPGIYTHETPRPPHQLSPVLIDRMYHRVSLFTFFFI